MRTRKPQRPTLLLLALSAVLIFVALMGFIGGALFVSDPSGAGMGMTLAALENTLFVDFFIPGLLLMLLYGIGGLVVLYAIWIKPRVPFLSQLTGFTREHWAWDLTLLLGVGLLIWLIYQLFTLPEIAPIQYLMLVIAAVIIALPLLPAMRRYYHE